MHTKKYVMVTVKGILAVDVRGDDILTPRDESRQARRIAQRWAQSTIRRHGYRLDVTDVRLLGDAPGKETEVDLAKK